MIYYIILFQFQKCLEELWQSVKSSNSKSRRNDSTGLVAPNRSTKAVSAVDMNDVDSDQV